MITHRYLFVLSFFLVASCGQVVAESSAESRMEKLEETVRILERRVTTLEDQLRQRNAAPSIPPDKANWRRLQKGLSEVDVERLLGSPTKVSSNIAYTRWEYGDSGEAYVHFDSQSRTVEGWQEP